MLGRGDHDNKNGVIVRTSAPPFTKSRQGQEANEKLANIAWSWLGRRVVSPPTEITREVFLSSSPGLSHSQPSLSTHRILPRCRNKKGRWPVDSTHWPVKTQKFFPRTTDKLSQAQLLPNHNVKLGPSGCLPQVPHATLPVVIPDCAHAKESTRLGLL